MEERFVLRWDHMKELTSQITQQNVTVHILISLQVTQYIIYLSVCSLLNDAISNSDKEHQIIRQYTLSETSSRAHQIFVMQPYGRKILCSVISPV
jgi:S-adenosylmethionine synthetase